MLVLSRDIFFERIVFAENAPRVHANSIFEAPASQNPSISASIVGLRVRPRFRSSPEPPIGAIYVDSVPEMKIFEACCPTGLPKTLKRASERPEELKFTRFGAPF